QRADDVERVSDDAEIGELEDRRVSVLVDRDDAVGPLDPDDVLRRAADADRDVDIGLDGLARLADLHPERRPPRVDDRTRRADGGAADRARELAQEREVARLAQAASARDHNLRILEPRARR